MNGQQSFYFLADCHRHWGGGRFPEHGTGRCKKSRPENVCTNNLRQIDGAKEQWALENQKKPGDEVDLSEMARYIKGEKIPTCPKGGKYNVAKVDEPVTCSISGHSLN